MILKHSASFSSSSFIFVSRVKRVFLRFSFYFYSLIFDDLVFDIYYWIELILFFKTYSIYYFYFLFSSEILSEQDFKSTHDFFHSFIDSL